jgi:hypothetical protein
VLSQLGARPILIGMALVSEPGFWMRDALSLLWQGGLFLC